MKPRPSISIALAATASLLTARAPAQENLSCSFFMKPNLLMIEDQKPIIPAALDRITLDLTLQQSCHEITWSVNTTRSTQDKLATEKVCFDIGATATDQRRDIMATFRDIAENGGAAGATRKLAEISAFEDRSMATELSGRCRRMQPAVATGLDI